jgi:epoxyqueuosine reductase
VNARLDPGEMAGLSRAEFRARFRRTPLERARYEGWLRNVATAMGNSGERRYRAALERLADSDDAGVAEHARWALERLLEAGAAEPVPNAPGVE